MSALRAREREDLRAPQSPAVRNERKVRVGAVQRRACRDEHGTERIEIRGVGRVADVEVLGPARHGLSHDGDAADDDEVHAAVDEPA